MVPRRQEHEFDVAISFAGEDREKAKAIVDSLKAKGFSVFYDKDQIGRLWGRRQDAYDYIYGPGSKYVIALVSKHYVEKAWPRYEFEVAKQEATKRRHEFLLPIRLDDSRLLGLPEDVNYLDLGQVSPKQVAQALWDKYEGAVAAPSRRSAGKRSRNQSRRIPVLSGRTRRALSIIASSVLSLKIEHYEELFPEIDWCRETRLLSRKRLLTRKHGGLTVPRGVKRALLSDPEEASEFSEAWVNALGNIGEHTDTAVLLATHYVGLGRLDDAVSALVSVVEGADLGWWNETYMTVLERLSERKVILRLKAESRVRLYNALGICLSGSGKHDEALQQFAKLRQISRRTGHSWGLGQSYINCGVACHRSGNDRRAESWYRKAVEHAKASGDRVLLGRSLSNLAQTVLDDSPEEAETLIRASIRAKRAGNDYAGLVTAHGLLGNLAAARGEFEEAAGWFRKAESEAKSLGLRYDRALVLHNLGRAYYDLGERRKALSRFRRSREVAEADGYADLLLLAVKGQARTYFELGRFAEAEASFRQLHDREKDAGNTEGVMVCLHDIGVCLLMRNRMTEARRSLNAALRAARRIGSSEWVVRCLVNRALTFGRGTLEGAGIDALKRAARCEQGRGAHAVAARLWETIAYELLAPGEFVRRAEAAFRNAERCYNQASGHHSGKARFYANLYRYRWDTRDYQGGLEALAKMARAADGGSLLLESFRAANQTGVCLDELGRLEEAEVSFRTARRLAKRLGNEDCLQDALNNLGETLRRRGRFRQAVKALADAENVARQRADGEGEISIAHNRALALQDRGDVAEAESVLRRCRECARRRSLSREYVRALEGLANLSYLQGNVALAGRRYSHALAEARKHRVRDVQAEIALNYATWLNHGGRPKDALRLLRRYEADLSSRTDSHVFYRTLAELNEKTGRLGCAVEAWKAAKEAATNVGNREAYAFCAAALAEAHEKLDEPTLSDAELREAIRNEDEPEGRALLLLQRFRLLLDNNKEKAAEKVYGEAKALISEHGLADVDLDLHMLLGDYEWGSRRGDKLNAMKAYVVAVLVSLEVSVEAFGTTGAHVVDQILRARGRISEEELDRLYADTAGWLREQNGDGEQIVRWGLWPLRVGKRALRALKTQDKLEKVLERIIPEEMPV